MKRSHDGEGKRGWEPKEDYPFSTRRLPRSWRMVPLWARSQQLLI